MPLAIGFAGLTVLTLASFIPGVVIPGAAWAAWGGVITTALALGGRANGRNGNGNGTANVAAGKVSDGG